jgi:hypothetical protein
MQGQANPRKTLLTNCDPPIRFMLGSYQSPSEWFDLNSPMRDLTAFKTCSWDVVGSYQQPMECAAGLINLCVET